MEIDEQCGGLIDMWNHNSFEKIGEQYRGLMKFMIEQKR